MAELQSSSEPSCSEQLFLPHHVRIMKVALALAILRQKPVGVAAREFTERLSLQFSQLQTNWKSKAEQLERELLKTRQDLIKCQLNSDVSKSDSLFQQHMHPRLPENAGADFNLDPSNSFPASEINPFHSQQQTRPQSRFPLSQIQVDSMYNYNTQLFESSSSQEIFSDGEWQSSGYSSSIPAQKENKSKLLLQSSEGFHQEETRPEAMVVVEGDSTVREGEEGCEREKEKVGDGKESYDLQEAGGVKGGSAMEERMEERMAAHVQFCTSVSSLASAGQHLSNLVATDLKEALRDTLLDAMKMLTDCFDSSKHHLTSSLPLSKKLLDEAMASIVESVQSPLMRVYRRELTEATVSLVKAVITKALQSDTQQKVVEALKGVTVKLCDISSVCHPSIELLVHRVINSAGLLQAAMSDPSCLTAECIDAAAVEFQFLEALLTAYSPSSIFTDHEREVIVEDLEDGVLGLSETFPLFVYCVWKVIGRLS